MKIRLAHVTNSSSSDYLIPSHIEEEDYEYEDYSSGPDGPVYKEEVRTILCDDGKHRELVAFKKYKEEKDQKIRAEFFLVFGKE